MACGVTPIASPIACSVFPATLMDRMSATLCSPDARVESVVDGVRRLLVDCTVEEKRRVLVELDRWVTLEEASFDPSSAPGRTH
jgi:hypothetical protein